MGTPLPIDMNRLDMLIAMALDEDLDTAGDTTTLAIVPLEARASGILLAKEQLVCAGLEVAQRVFQTVDFTINFQPLCTDGQLLESGAQIARIEGPARSILTAERTVLNFLQRLCGIATAAHRYQSAVAPGSKTIILDTRKTTPGYRNLEKYAVCVGGASNHRIGLYDRIMIKDNHLEIAGYETRDAIAVAVLRARECYPNLKIEVEVDTLEQLDEVLNCPVDYVLLDNMSDNDMARAVEKVQGRFKLEASGGITLERITQLSHIGVDYISVGALTHSVKSADISLDILPKR